MAKLVRIDAITDIPQIGAQYLHGVACIGVFDGLHRGHNYLINETIRHAKAAQANSLIITFDIDPDELFSPHSIKKLSTNEKRIARLIACGVDVVLVLPFSQEFACLEPEAFLQKVLQPFSLMGLHVGSDFRFGCKARGTVETLNRWGGPLGCKVFGHELVDVDGLPISATRIRTLLAHGSIKQANELLGYSYTLSGDVLRGRGQGGSMGFKTANLKIGPELLALADGVYAACVPLDGILYNAAVSVGVSPTFEEEADANVEVHVLDFEGELYNESIDVEFDVFLRPMIKFEDTQTLISTVRQDIQWVRENGRGSLAR